MDSRVWGCPSFCGHLRREASGDFVLDKCRGWIDSHMYHCSLLIGVSGLDAGLLWVVTRGWFLAAAVVFVFGGPL